MSTRARYRPWFRDLRTMADVSDGETLEEDGDWVLVTYRDGRRAMILKVLLEDRWLTLVVPRSEMTEVLGLPTHKSHFATCPNAAAHRKAKR